MVNKKSSNAKGKNTFNKENILGLKVCNSVRHWEDVSQCFVFLILSVFPLLMGTNKYVSITGDKFNIFLVLSLCFLAAIVFIFFKNFKGDSRQIQSKRFELQSLSVPQLFIIIYIAWNIISAITSSYGEQTILGMGRKEGLISALIYGIVFILISYWGEYSNIFVYGLGAMAAILGFIAAIQSFGSTAIYPNGYNYWNSSFLSTIGHEDVISGYVAICVPVLIAAYAFVESKWRYTALSGIFFISYTQFFSDVDSGKIGLLAASVVLVPFLCNNGKAFSRTLQAFGVFVFAAFIDAFLQCKPNMGPAPNFGKKAAFFLIAAIVFAAIGILAEKRNITFKIEAEKLKHILALVMIFCIVAGLVFVYAYKGEIKLIKEASEMLHGNMSDEAGSIRGYIWKSAIEIFKNNPMGSGPGTFAGQFESYNAGYQQYADNTVVDMAHNDFLQIMVCTGIIGIVLYLGFIITLFIRAIIAEKRCPLIAIMLGGIVGYLAHSFFSFSIAIITPLFWVMAGVLDKMCRQTGVTGLQLKQKLQSEEKANKK